jgi:hypothetical protein
MKKIAFVTACLIGLVLCSAAVAYYPMLIVRECPHCKAHVVEEQSVSGNTIGSRLYTDGKREAKMLPDHPWLVRCPICSNLFFVDEAVEVDMGFDAAEGKLQVIAPSAKEIQDFLAGSTLAEDKELYLRLRLWWKANDAWRFVPDAKPSFSNEQAQNIEALSALLDDSLPGHRILKAEIARELGNFDQCLLLLSYQFEPDYGWTVDFIKRLAEEKAQAVKPFE